MFRQSIQAKFLNATTTRRMYYNLTSKDVGRLAPKQLIRARSVKPLEGQNFSLKTSTSFLYLQNVLVHLRFTKHYVYQLAFPMDWIYHGSDLPWVRFTMDQIYHGSDLPWIGFSMDWIYYGSDLPCSCVQDFSRIKVYKRGLCQCAKIHNWGMIVIVESPILLLRLRTKSL